MNNFTDESYAAFEKAAIEKYDFSTCQRPDGSKYGSPGRCIKGSETSPASKDDKKSSSKASGGGGSGGGEYRTRPKGAIESDMKKLTSSGAMNQKGTAGVKAREEHANLKAELKKPLKGANSKSGTGTKQQPKKGGGGDVAIAPAPKKTTSKDPVKNVLNEQKKTKDFLKKDNAKMAKDNPKLAKMQRDMEARKAKEKAARERD